MKKTYQKPELMVTVVANTDIICTSPLIQNQKQELDGAPEIPTGISSGNLGKERGDYGDENFGDLW
ncbi:MAG: hypothetical protein IJV06_08050 [Bacteroidaceae bacterium]|nr:hypothetical protein [Bacteroidaceae bacterium]